MDLGQVALTLVALFCFGMCVLLLSAWTARDIAEGDQYRYYRGIDMHQMPDGSIAEQIKWLKEQEPTDGGLRIRDSRTANRVILAYKRHGKSKQ